MLLKAVLLAVAAYVAYRVVRNAFSGVLGGGGSGGGGGSKFKCSSCKNCKNLFDDGVICAFGRRETFKNETHIANCQDYQQGRAG